ncbi:hypothetical protein HDU81_010081 [Chytriomyces hyalinus]|nr:hypothetical protein HDU81_010081 [Chytriomyces hyalinus]
MSRLIESVRHAKNVTATEDISHHGHIKTEGILSHHSVVIKPPKHSTTAKPIHSSALLPNANTASNSMNLDSEKLSSSRPNSPAPSEMSEFEAPIDTSVFQRQPICGTLQKKLIAEASQPKRRGRPPKRKVIDEPLAVQVGASTTVSPKLKRTRAIIRDSPEANSESLLEKSKPHRKMRSDNEFAGSESSPKNSRSRQPRFGSSSMDESDERKSGTNIPFVDGVQRRSKRIRSAQIPSEVSDIDSSEPDVASKVPRRDNKSENIQVVHRASGNFSDCDTVSDDSDDDTSQKFERLDVHGTAHLSTLGSKIAFTKVRIPLPTRTKSGSAPQAASIVTGQSRNSNPQNTGLPRIPYKPVDDSESGKSKQQESSRPKARAPERKALSMAPSIAIDTVKREISPLNTRKSTSATPLSEPQTIQTKSSISSATVQIITMPPFSNIRAPPSTSKTTNVTNVTYPPVLSAPVKSPYMIRSVSLLKSPPHPSSGYGPIVSDPQEIPAQHVPPRMSSVPQTSQQSLSQQPFFASRSFSQPSAPTQSKPQHHPQQLQPIYFRPPSSLPPAPPPSAVPASNAYWPARPPVQQPTRPTVQTFYTSSSNQKQRPRVSYSQDPRYDTGRQNSNGRVQGGDNYNATSGQHQRPTSSPNPQTYPNSAPASFSQQFRGYTPADRPQFSAPFVQQQGHLPYRPPAYPAHHHQVQQQQQQHQQQQQQAYYFANNQGSARDSRVFMSHSWRGGLPPK